ncbi:uncharacterized protein LOC142985300 isoform X1 [Anticarsia gemmatalis]|uniref:uncharacterized protein LOC142985300 isoform X1 n=1 Tax=Anticarsia gemmatalis TaxID=129554 RepID=UPI003F770303
MRVDEPRPKFERNVPSPITCDQHNGYKCQFVLKCTKDSDDQSEASESVDTSPSGQVKVETPEAGDSPDKEESGEGKGDAENDVIEIECPTSTEMPKELMEWIREYFTVTEGSTLQPENQDESYIDLTDRPSPVTTHRGVSPDYEPSPSTSPFRYYDFGPPLTSLESGFSSASSSPILPYEPLVRYLPENSREISSRPSTTFLKYCERREAGNRSPQPSTSTQDAASSSQASPGEHVFKVPNAVPQNPGTYRPPYPQRNGFGSNIPLPFHPEYQPGSIFVPDQYIPYHNIMPSYAVPPHGEPMPYYYEPPTTYHGYPMPHQMPAPHWLTYHGNWVSYQMVPYPVQPLRPIDFGPPRFALEDFSMQRMNARSNGVNRSRRECRQRPGYPVPCAPYMEMMNEPVMQIGINLRFVTEFPPEGMDQPRSADAWPPNPMQVRATQYIARLNRHPRYTPYWNEEARSQFRHLTPHGGVPREPCHPFREDDPPSGPRGPSLF